ncbi:MAG: methyltransferase domain-containing protein [Opitutaceae bacterium]
MKLWQTRRHWEKFARTDPHWAVLTAPDKRNGRWDEAEFFATGRATIEGELARVRAIAPDLRFGHALDFGCGVGRLTQALAQHFARATGVDISTQMLALARAHNPHADRVTFVHNSRPDLSCFASGTFDFVYSLITLQHLAPAYAHGYIREFIRVLAPGGVALFQIPARSIVPPRRRFSWSPGTRLWRLANRSLAAQPIMEMHAISRDQVLATLASAGAEVLDVFRYDPDGRMLESYGYIARRP